MVSGKFGALEFCICGLNCDFRPMHSSRELGTWAKVYMAEVREPIRANDSRLGTSERQKNSIGVRKRIRLKVKRSASVRSSPRISAYGCLGDRNTNIGHLLFTAYGKADHKIIRFESLFKRCVVRRRLVTSQSARSHVRKGRSTAKWGIHAAALCQERSLPFMLRRFPLRFNSIKLQRLQVDGFLLLEDNLPCV